MDKISNLLTFFCLEQSVTLLWLTLDGAKGLLDN
jgi:hypothetical protein